MVRVMAIVASFEDANDIDDGGILILPELASFRVSFYLRFRRAIISTATAES